ncbi:ribosomal protein L11 methyltransferase-like protein [Wolffia australiana]
MQNLSRPILQRCLFGNNLRVLLKNYVGISSSRPRSLVFGQRKMRFGGFCASACSPCQSEFKDTLSDSFLLPSLSVTINCLKRDVDVLSEALLCFGASSASIDESDDLEANEEVSITSIFTADQDVSRCISLAAQSTGLKTPNFEVTLCKDFDWVQNVKDTFQPIQVAGDLWVVPEWRAPADVNATNIFLNPGMAFGTGEHPTTKLCLLLLKGLIKGGEHVLDYGTGSGVLGIAAIKMGAAFSVGIDIEPQAISSAHQNITLNGIDPSKMQLYLAPIKEEIKADGPISLNGSFDIIIANILLNPLMELSEELVSYGRPGAVIGLSGFLPEQIAQIEERYSKYLEGIYVSEMDGWACLTGTKI